MAQGNGPAGVRWLNVISLAGAFCAFCIGSGFASGQEVMQFFTSHGLFSFGALFISMFLFMWLASTIMVAGYDMKIKTTTDIFPHYCGFYIGKFYEYFIPFFLFCVVVIMFAGTGDIMAEYYGINPYVGRVLMAGISLLSAVLGLNKLIKVIGAIGPVIIVLSIIIGLVAIFTSPAGVTEGAQTATTLEVPKAAPQWYISGLLYAAFMIPGSAPFFAGIGSEANSRKEALYGGLLGGFALMLAATIMSTGMLSNIGLVFDKQAPTLALAGASSGIVATIFSIILILGIYSTAAPMLWSVCNRIADDGTPKFKLLAVILTVAAFFGAQFPFGKLVGTIYPYTGYLGILFFICMIYRIFMPSAKSASHGK